MKPSRASDALAVVGPGNLDGNAACGMTQAYAGVWGEWKGGCCTNPSIIRIDVKLTKCVGD